MLNFALTQEEKAQQSHNTNPKVLSVLILLCLSSSFSLYHNFYHKKTPSPDGVQMVTYNYFQKTLSIYPNKKDDLFYQFGFSNHPDYFWSDEGNRLAINQNFNFTQIYDKNHPNKQNITVENVFPNSDSIDYEKSTLEISSFHNETEVYLNLNLAFHDGTYTSKKNIRYDYLSSKILE